MPRIEHLREVPPAPPVSYYWQARLAAGWMPVAVVWERQVEGEPEPSGELDEDVPYGLQVAADGSRLVEHPAEKQALLLMMSLIVEDAPLARVAVELNGQGLRTRQGTPWGPGSVFDMLPRLIQVGPRVFSSEEWAARRQQLRYRMSANDLRSL